MNPMEQLKDIHLNPAISQWPPAIGWWVLTLLILLTTTLVTLYLIRRHRHRQALRDALRQVNQLKPDSGWPQSANQLLKRACISYYPAERVASLHQSDWIAFLCAQVSEKKAAQYRPVLTSLINGLYDGHGPKADFSDSQRVVTQWLKAALPPGKKQREASRV